MAQLSLSSLRGSEEFQIKMEKVQIPKGLISKELAWQYTLTSNDNRNGRIGNFDTNLNYLRSKVGTGSKYKTSQIPVKQGFQQNYTV